MFTVLGIKFLCTWPECEYENRSKTKFKLHFYNHKERPVVECEWNGCNRKYKNPISYRNHLKFHAGTTFICKDENCGQHFLNHSKLSTHRKMHNNQNCTEL